MKTHDPIERGLLNALKNRPELEPNPEFVQNLKKSLVEEGLSLRPNGKWRKNGRILILMSAAIVVFSILTASILSQQGDSLQPGRIKNPTTVVEKENHEKIPKFDLLYSSNRAYKEFYEKILLTTGMKEQSKSIIYYFEALKQKDGDTLSKLLVDDKDVQSLMEYYEGMDVTSIVFRGIVPQSDQPAFEILFSFVDEKTNTMKEKSIFFDYSDEKNVKIKDAAMEKEWDSKKDEAIIFKLKEIGPKLKIGMTKNEAAQIFGPDYKVFVNPDAEDGSVETWSYRYFVEPGTVSTTKQPYIIDLPNFQNQNIGLELVISWNRDGKAIWFNTISGYQGRVISNFLNSEGSREEVLSPVGGASGESFQLTDEEKQAYGWFKVEYDEENLRKLSPISIAKLYVQASIDQDRETQYELYTKRKDRVLWSKEEHMNFPEDANGSKENTLKMFSGIENGKFIQQSNYEGYIHFESENGPSGFQMVKDENGIWKVGFMPIQ